MTLEQLREAISQVEASGLHEGILRVTRPTRPYRRDRVELAPLVYGQEVGTCGPQILVLVELAGLRRILSLADLADAPPQGTV